MSGNTILQRFINKKPRELGFNLIQRFGQPNLAVQGRLEWYGAVPNVVKIVLLDESIPHDFPMAHHDFVYSTANIKVSPQQAAALALVSGSIIIDQLKGQTTARCGALIKNQITLGFVYDYVNGKIKVNNPTELKKVYGERIMADQVSESKLFDPVYGVKPSTGTVNNSPKSRMYDLWKSSMWMRQ